MNDNVFMTLCEKCGLMTAVSLRTTAQFPISTLILEQLLCMAMAATFSSLFEEGSLLEHFTILQTRNIPTKFTLLLYAQLLLLLAQAETRWLLLSSNALQNCITSEAPLLYDEDADIISKKVSYIFCHLTNFCLVCLHISLIVSCM